MSKKNEHVGADIENRYDKDKFSEIVKAAKGPRRTVQQFAADVGVSPSTLTRIINKQNGTASKESLLVAIADNAAPDSGVTLEMLMEANGNKNRAAMSAMMLEQTGSEILQKELLEAGIIKDSYDCVIDDSEIGREELAVRINRNSQKIFDMLVKSEKYGKWAFDFKVSHGVAGSGRYQRWIWAMANILQTSDINKISMVIYQKTLYDQMRRLLDDVGISKTLSVIYIDLKGYRIIEEYCSGKQYGLWRGFDDDKVFLTDILKARYKEKYKGYDNTGVKEDTLANYCKDRREELVDLMKRLGLEGELELLKDNDGKRKGYVFYRSEEPFINELLDERSKQLVNVRKGQHAKLDDDYAIHLYENIFNMFVRRCDNSEFEAYRHTFGVYNLLDIPVHKQNIMLRQMQKSFEGIVDKVFEERLRNITSRNDDLAWISYVTEDMRRLYKKSMRMYDLMYEIRQKEINEKAEAEYESMSAKEIERIEEEDCLTMLIYQKYIQNSDVRKLLEEQSKITGATLPWEISINNANAGKSRDELTLSEISRLEEIDKQLEGFYEAAREYIIKDTIGAANVEKAFEKDYLYPAGDYMTSDDLVQSAELEYEKEYRREMLERGAG